MQMISFDINGMPMSENEESTLNCDGTDDKPALADEDNVNHPTHYLGSIECIDAIEAAIECLYDPVNGFLIGNIIKYVWRWQEKGGVEDLKKARWYLDRIIEREGKQR